MTDGLVDEESRGVTSLDHVSVNKLHALGTLSAELTRNDDFATLGRALHNKSENAIASTTNSQSHKKLVAEGLSLGDGAQGTVGNALGIELDGSLK